MFSHWEMWTCQKKNVSWKYVKFDKTLYWKIGIEHIYRNMLLSVFQEQQGLFSILKQLFVLLYFPWNREQKSQRNIFNAPKQTACLILFHGEIFFFLLSI